MAVGFSGIETVYTALVYFGYEGSAYASFPKLTDDIIGTVVAEPMVDFASSSLAVSGTGYSQVESVLFHHAGDFIKIYKL